MNRSQSSPLNDTPFSEALSVAHARLKSIVDISNGIPDMRKPDLRKAIDNAITRFGRAPSNDVIPWIRKTRREILNLFELSLGDKNPMWPLVRNHLFGVFGPDGLEGDAKFLTGSWQKVRKTETRAGRLKSMILISLPSSLILWGVLPLHSPIAGCPGHPRAPPFSKISRHQSTAKTFVT
ncbi:MAG TPA: hypothetical protein VE954_13550 [Oligoflexus sp.]|uniref:hypothetical protein n=1 Tax=Oligoflexus sp. TaxID=1971216 RepID=UPI002D24B595|nr:hypothetical protein [Oligoflexus sp.]HYX34128.1 hypothetical protein [Oligoflexus sp.]